MAGSRRPAAARRQSRGQTETIGVVLILAMTLIGATIALAFGASALDEARLSSQEEGIQHALTQLDSRAAMVALGDSQVQHVPLGAAGAGSYRVDPDAGWIRIEHSDYNTTSGADEVLYNESLGALVYEHRDVLIAYQGGGVWRAQGPNSTMVSPPEFHYQSATLTFPVIRLSGDSSTSGAGVTAKVRNLQSADRIYPSNNLNYSDGSPYANPIREGNVTITVKSDYWEAWATYFDTRTDGVITVDPANETVSVLLISQGISGDFEMPADGNAIELRGLGDGHPVKDFNVTIRPDDTDSANFANLQWTLWAEKGSQEFEIHLRDGGSNDDPGTPCTERDVDATVYYSDTNGDPYEGWHADDAFVTSCDDLDGDGDNETYLKVDLVGDAQLSIASLSNSELQHFSASGDTNLDPITFDEHDGDPTAPWEPKTFDSAGDPDTTIGNLTNHYLSLMGPDVELTVEDKGSDTVDEESSTGTFEQDGSAGKFITFLHITENRVSVELE